VLRGLNVFQEHPIRTTGDAVQDRRLAEIGGKGLFAKEIHEALAGRRIDFAVHSLKDLETVLPPAIVLACTRRREGARDALILDPDAMVPAAGQGIIGVTVREDDGELRELLAAIEDPEARAVSTAERAMLAALDGSCRTPIGGHARLLPDGRLHLTGMIARAD